MLEVMRLSTSLQRVVKLGSASRPAPDELDARDAHPDLYRWRRVLLSAMPFAALAFVLGIAFELAGEPSAFDLAAYSSGALFILLLEGLLYRYPERLAAVVTLLTGSMSLFFIGKLVYLLFFAAAGTDILSELTESFSGHRLSTCSPFLFRGCAWAASASASSQSSPQR